MLPAANVALGLEAGALALAAPLLLFPGRWAPLGALLLLLPWAWRLIAERRLSVRTPMDWPVAGLLAMAGVGLFVSVDASLSLPKVYGLLFGVAVFFALANQGRTPARRAAAGGLLVVAAVAVAGLALVGTEWKGRGWGLVDGLLPALPQLITQVQTSQTVLPGFHANEVGGALGLLLPLVLAPLAFRRPDRWTALAAAAAGLVGGTLLLTQSRGGLLGLGFGMLVLLSLRWRCARWLWPLAGLLALGGLLWLGPHGLAELFLAVESTTGRGSWAMRVELWERALQIIGDFPFTGSGFNTFPVLTARLYPVFSWPGGLIPHSHNLFLQVAVDLGLPGLTAFLWLLAAVGRRLIRAWHSRASGERWLVAGIVAGLASHLVYSLTDAVTLGAKPGFLLWALFGLVAAMEVWGAGEPGGTRRTGREQDWDGGR